MPVFSATAHRPRARFAALLAAASLLALPAQAQSKPAVPAASSVSSRAKSAMECRV